jgi:hypothetical protein
MPMRCEDCRYYTEAEITGDDGRIDYDVSRGWGQCHLHPPVVSPPQEEGGDTVQLRLPTVIFKDFCSGWAEMQHLAAPPPSCHCEDHGWSPGTHDPACPAT